MSLGHRAQLTVLLVFFVVAAAEPRCDSSPQLGAALPGLTAEQQARFEAGRQIFARVFTAEEGLGPLFNANACAECHEDPMVGGVGDESELHAAIAPVDLGPMALSATSEPGEAGPEPRREDLSPAQAGCDLLFERGGPVYQLEVTPALRAALGIDREPVPAEASTAQRSTPDVFGFGLLDAIPDSVLLALADPDDADGDGISGRVNRFVDGRIGRFGRKAFVPTLAEFNAAAFQIEQGITTFAALDEGSVGGTPLPAGVDPLPEPELADEDVLLAADFVRFLAPPPPRKKGREARFGEKIFATVGCAACHVPVLRTGPSDVEALAHREVRAYTDLLLHDMGPELADICFGLAAPAEFRTEPLMGLGLSRVFLHDGRAQSIEEAILLHGGEGERAQAAFRALPERHRRALLTFLGGL